MSEPPRETLGNEDSSFLLDKDLSKVTSNQIKSYLNDGFMRGRVSAKDFARSLLSVAVISKSNVVVDEALHAYAVSLGHLVHSSQMVSGEAYAVLDQGPENNFTQSIIKEISTEHIGILRNLYTRENRPLFAKEAYLLSLRYAPKIAEKEDIEILCKGFEGFPPSPFFPAKTGEAAYYPREILDIVDTAQEVMGKRPELVDPNAFLAVYNLPERIKGATYFTRPSFDRDVSKAMLEAAACERKSQFSHFGKSQSSQF